jgi:hypothetical protein
LTIPVTNPSGQTATNLAIAPFTGDISVDGR